MLRPNLTPQTPQTKAVAELADVISRIESALEGEEPTEALMEQHNRLAQRNDIDAEQYWRLYSSMSCEEAALEALMPVAQKVDDLTRDELEDIAKRILQPENHHETAYYLELFERNTPSGTSDLFFWPDKDWLQELGTDQPSPAQIVDKALIANAIVLG